MAGHERLDGHMPLQRIHPHGRIYMKAILASLNYFYSKLLLLYPRRFRDEFAGEMQDVFSDSLNEAIKDGILSLLILCLRELGGCIGHIRCI